MSQIRPEGDGLPEPSVHSPTPPNLAMDANRYGSFRFRLGLSVLVWIVFLGALYLLAGFRAMPGGGLHSLLVDWLRAVNVDDRGSSMSIVASRIISLSLLLAGPPIAAALASPFFGTGHVAGKPEIDFSDPAVARPSLFYWPLARYWAYYDVGRQRWSVFSPLALLCVASLLDVGGLYWSHSYLAKVGLTWSVTVWVYILWTVLLSLLPGAVRRILDWRATRRALLSPKSRVEQEG